MPALTRRYGNVTHFMTNFEIVACACHLDMEFAPGVILTQADIKPFATYTAEETAAVRAVANCRQCLTQRTKSAGR